MTLTPASFRGIYREFEDPKKYTPEAVEFWLTVAGNSLDCDRWGKLYDMAVSLFTAHHLVLSARDQRTVAAGGIPGEVQGIATAKAVDKVSKSMEVPAVTVENGAYWNMTRYGVQLLTYALMQGAGPVQFGIGHPPPGAGGGSFFGF